jgi:L-lysine exporter family protein LysE/ArgO
MTAALGAFQLGLFPVLMATLSLGPQNTFVLRHGLARDRVSLVAGVCLGCDIVIIVTATLGFGAVIAANPLATRLLTGAGAGYLLLGATRMLRSACDGSAPPPLGCSRGTPAATLLQAFGVSVLNPLVWVATVLVLSALASTLSLPLLPYFGLGAACGSLAKFSLLSFAARGLASLFVRHSVRRGFDALAGTAMLAMTLIIAWPIVSIVTVHSVPARQTLGEFQACTDPVAECASLFRPTTRPVRLAVRCRQAPRECLSEPEATPLQVHWIE